MQYRPRRVRVGSLGLSITHFGSTINVQNQANARILSGINENTKVASVQCAQGSCQVKERVSA